MSITINDGFTLDNAIEARRLSKEAEALLAEVEQIISKIEGLTDHEVDASSALEDVQAAIVICSNDHDEAINKWTAGG